MFFKAGDRVVVVTSDNLLDVGTVCEFNNFGTGFSTELTDENGRRRVNVRLDESDEIIAPRKEKVALLTSQTFAKLQKSVSDGHRRRQGELT
jgi:hypothetical protein